MSYKNTMKLFASNFTLVWKQLLYLICVIFIFSVCSYTIATPVLELLKENGVVEDIKNLFTTVYETPSEFAITASESAKHFLGILIDNFSSIWLNLIGTIVLCVILPYVFIQMSVYNISSILYQKFTMNMNANYAQNAVRTLKQSLRYAFANLILIMPFIAGLIIMIEVYLLCATSIWSAIIGMIVFMALLIVLVSLKISVFTNYTAYMVENDADPFVAFAKSLGKSVRNFWKTLSVSVILVLTIILVNGLIAIFTFFSGLIVTIPATYVLIAIYNLVTYFNEKGTRYYLSNTIIYNPVQYTVKKDDYVSISVPEATDEIQVTTTVMKKKYKKTKSSKPKSKSAKNKKTKSKNIKNKKVKD